MRFLHILTPDLPNIGVILTSLELRFNVFCGMIIKNSGQEILIYEKNIDRYGKHVFNVFDCFC